MIFLIEYDREIGRIATMHEFSDSDRNIAEKQRIEMEIRLNEKHIDHEVVLLHAATLDALKLTHNRYFADLAELQRG